MPAEGEWSTGTDGVMKRHGVGTYKSGDNEYVGEWKDDAMDGQGKFTFASGAVYEVTSQSRRLCALRLVAPLTGPCACFVTCRERGQTTSSWERASTNGQTGRHTQEVGPTISMHTPPPCGH